MPRSVPCRRPRWRSSRSLLPDRARTGSASGRSSTPCSRRWSSTPAAPPGRLLGATAEEVEAAIDTAVRALAHPLLRRAADAARAGRCRRECPVGVQVESGVLVEGVVDAAFLEEGEGWTVVDFKTDVEIAGRLEEYQRQVWLYAEAVARATGVR